MDIPLTEPTEFFPGDTLTWKRQDLSDDYPASDGWSLTYYFRGPEGKFDIAASADGDNFSVSVLPDITTTYKSGDYIWSAKVGLGTDVYSVDNGACTVKVDLATKGAGYDPRSHVKKVLDALEAALVKKASKDQLETDIDGVSIKRMSPEELRAWRKEYKSEYQKELNADKKKNGKKSGDRIVVRFI